MLDMSSGDCMLKNIPYFFSYKAEFFPNKTVPKNLDTSYKLDLDFLDCLGRVKTCITANFHRTVWRGETPSCSEINTLFRGTSFLQYQQVTIILL